MMAVVIIFATTTGTMIFSYVNFTIILVRTTIITALAIRGDPGQRWPSIGWLTIGQLCRGGGEYAHDGD